MDDALYRELYQYETLEAAYETAFLYLRDPPADEEPWLINLQNHLVWESYQTGDEDRDTVLLEAMDIVMKRHGLRGWDLGGAFRRLHDELTLT